MEVLYALKTRVVLSTAQAFTTMSALVRQEPRRKRLKRLELLSKKELVKEEFTLRYIQ